MKTIPYTKMIALCLVFLTGINLMAQPPGGRKINIEELRARLENEISLRTGINSEEGQKFFPLLHEMKQKQRKISRKIYQIKQTLPANASEKQYTEAILEIKSLNVQMAKIEEDYYKQMCKAISAGKVYAAMIAEDEFHRKVLSDFNRNRRK